MRKKFRYSPSKLQTLTTILLAAEVFSYSIKSMIRDLIKPHVENKKEKKKKNKNKERKK